MTLKAFLDRIVREVPFVLDVDIRQDAYHVILLQLRLWKGVGIQEAMRHEEILVENTGFIDTLLQEWTYKAQRLVSEALAKEWTSAPWKGILRHEGFEKMVPLDTPIPLIQYDIPVLLLDCMSASYSEEAMVPTLPQRRIEFHLQDTNPRTRVAYYSSQRR